MDLEQLKKLGAFVPSEPIKRSVTWTRMVDGEEKSDAFDVYVRKRSFGDVEKLLGADNDERSKSARFLSECILLGEGNKRTPMTYEQAYQLEISLARVLIDAVNEVNGTIAAVKK